MPQTLNYWVLQSLAMGLTVFFIPKLRVTSIFGPIFAVVGLALVNTFVWDTALFFSIPDALTYKVALLFITNGFIFWLLIKLLPGIEVEGFLPALIAPVVFTFCSVLISAYGKDIDWEKVYKQSLLKVQEVKRYLDETMKEEEVEKKEEKTPLPEKPK